MPGSAESSSAPIRTKIVATMGPAVRQPRDLKSLLKAGVDVCRLNFSHGELPDHATMLANIRKQADLLDKRVAVLGDLGGPKIRVGQIDEDNADGGLRVEPGDELIVQREAIVGKKHVITSTYTGLVDDVDVGDKVLIEDGLLKFLCVRKEPESKPDRIVLRCTTGGVVKTRKGINLPSTKLGLPSITDRDWQCVDWAIEHDLDYLALSFVRRADDIRQLRERLRSRGSHIGIIAKIEKAEAMEEIGAIIHESDGLMVARGDLGVEMDVAQVPIIQKDLIRRCHRAGKPAIVATQMLQSMVEAASPTRAEVSDVANAIYDGTDATMLSGETSVGKFPVGTVHIMQHVARTTENYLAHSRSNESDGASDAPGMVISQATAKAVRRLLETLPCKLVVVYSQSGDTARIFAKQRFDVPVIALSGEERRLRQMSLLYGVVPIHLDPPANLQSLADDVDTIVQDRELAEVGDRIVIVAGRSMGASETMNGIVIHTVGHANPNPCVN
jgi:pyruvate kinase